MILLINKNNFIMVSAAAYLEKLAQPNSIVYENSKCDMLFVMEPTNNGWIIRISTYSEVAKKIKEFLVQKVQNSSIKVL